MAYADIYGQSDSYPAGTLMLQREFKQDNNPATAPTQLEQAAASAGFLTFVGWKNRLGFLEEQFNIEKLFVPADIKQKRQENIALFSRIKECIECLKSDETDERAKEEALEELKKFVRELPDVVVSEEVKEDLANEIKTFMEETPDKNLKKKDMAQEGVNDSEIASTGADSAPILWPLSIEFLRWFHPELLPRDGQTIMVVGPETNELPRQLSEQYPNSLIIAVNPKFVTRREDSIYYIGKSIQDISKNDIETDVGFVFSSGLFNPEYREKIVGRHSVDPSDIYCSMLTAIRRVLSRNGVIILLTGTSGNSMLEQAAKRIGLTLENLGEKTASDPTNPIGCYLIREHTSSVLPDREKGSIQKNLKKRDVAQEDVEAVIREAIEGGRALGIDLARFKQMPAQDAVDALFTGTPEEIATKLVGAFVYESDEARINARKQLSQYLARSDPNILKDALKLLIQTAQSSSQETLQNRRLVILLTEDGPFASCQALAHSGTNSIYLHINTLSVNDRKALQAILEHEDRDLLRGSHEDDIPNAEFTEVKRLWENALCYGQVTSALNNLYKESNSAYWDENPPENFDELVQYCQEMGHGAPLRKMLILMQENFDAFLEYKQLISKLLPLRDDVLKLKTLRFVSLDIELQSALVLLPYDVPSPETVSEDLARMKNLKNDIKKMDIPALLAGHLDDLLQKLEKASPQEKQSIQEQLIKDIVAIHETTITSIS
ncbi:MAG: hypothetical protein ACTSPB_23835, partial [Candidatus Thorarchaeota archaeon]